MSNEIDKVEEPVETYGIEYTYADYLKFDFEEMVELIRGKIFKMSPAQRTIHQIIAGNIHGHLWSALRGQECRTFIVPFDVILPIKNKKRDKATTVVQPDICVICNAEIIEDAGCFGVPDLIIEINAGKAAKKDIRDKYSVYEEAGVMEYWIVFASIRCIEVFHLVEGKYQRINTYVEDDTIPIKCLNGKALTMDEIFESVDKFS